MTLLLTLIIIIAVVIFEPLLAIWSVNTLFHVGIEYTLATWFAAAVLSAILYGASSSSSSSS